MYLSDGEYTVDDVISDYPIDTFGLGAGHRPETLLDISEKTSGVYSYVTKDLDKIKDAFAQYIGGVTSVAAIDLEIKVQTHQGVRISSIESGSYFHEITSGNKVGTIKINDLCAGETKNFIVFLTIPEGNGNLITVTGSYKNRKNDTIQLGKSKVVVKQPTTSTAAVHPEVAGEIARLRLVNDVMNMATRRQFSKNRLQGLWDNAPRQAFSDLGKGVSAMQSEDEVKPFMFSWLTSQQRQRATTKGSPSEFGDFQTPAMKNMLRIVDNELSYYMELIVTLKIMWRKVIITWARSNPCSCAPPSVIFLLLPALLLLIMYLGTLTTKTTIIIGDITSSD
jgi:hypothetical protein